MKNYTIAAICLSFAALAIGGLAYADRDKGSDHRKGSDHKNWSYRGKAVPVKIKNEPIEVRTSAQQPLQMTDKRFNESGAVAVVLIAEAPSDLRLVMQHVAIEVNTAFKDNAYVDCVLIVDDGMSPVRLNLNVIKRRTGNFHQHLASEPITMYAEAGDQVRARCNAQRVISDEILDIVIDADVPVMDTTLIGYFTESHY